MNEWKTMNNLSTTEPTATPVADAPRPHWLAALTNATSNLRRMFAATLGVAILAMSSGSLPAQDSSADWREEFAYTLGVQAYIYGFPWNNLAYYRWLWVTQPPINNEHLYAPLNMFCHSRSLKDSSSTGGGAPNNDTLYSSAWLYLNEPVVLTVPVIDRYYSFEMACMDSDNFAYVGKRYGDTNGGDFLIMGPDAKESDYPTNQFVRTFRSRTPYIIMAGRTVVYDTNDLANVHAIQDQYKLTPLSCWHTGKAMETNQNVWMPFPTANDPLAAWRTMNRAMTENPPNDSQQEALVKSFAQIGIGPGMGTNLEQLDLATQRGLIRAAVEGHSELVKFASNGTGLVTNGWLYPPKGFGRCGEHYEFMGRAAAQCLMGIISSDAEEGTYIQSAVDDSGVPLFGTNAYTITFPPNKLPDVGAFWSISMYNYSNNFVTNELKRYKIGSYPANQLVANADGSITIYVQYDSPGDDKVPNWLPAPNDKFYLILRCYMPGNGIVDQTWVPPAVTQVKNVTTHRNLQLRVVNNRAQLSWTGVAGLRFRVQSANEILPNQETQWETLPREITSSLLDYDYTDDNLAPSKFYRVLRVP